MCEKNIIEGCSPTLAGLKTGNLISVGYPDVESLYADIREMNRIFVRKGLCAVPLGYSGGRGLIYIYRTADLKRDLRSPEARLGAALQGCRRGSRF